MTARFSQSLAFIRRRLPFLLPFQGSVYLPPCHEPLRILLRLRRPKATPREAISSFSFLPPPYDRNQQACQGRNCGNREACTKPKCDKDPDSVFLPFHCQVQPGKRKPPVRKTTLPSKSGSLSQHGGKIQASAYQSILCTALPHVAPPAL